MRRRVQGSDLVAHLAEAADSPCAPPHGEGKGRAIPRAAGPSSRPAIYDRALLGDLSRVAARTITAFIRTTVGEPGLSVGIVASIQTQVKSNIEYPTRNLE